MRENESSGGRREAAVMILAAVTIHLLSLAVPLLTLQVYDRILKYPGQGTLVVLVAGVTVAILLEWLVKTMRSAIECWKSALFEHSLLCSLMDKALAVLPGRRNLRGASARIHDLSVVGSLKERYGGEGATVWVELPFAGLFLGIIAYLTGWLVLVPVTLVGIFSLVALLIGRRLRTASRAREQAEEARDDVMLEALEAVHLLKAMTMERPFQRRYEAVQSEVSLTGFRTACWSGLAQALGGWCAQAMTILVMAAGAPLVVSGSLTTGALVAAILLAGRLMPPVQRALSFWTRKQEFTLAEQRLQEIFAEPSRLLAAASDAPSKGALEVEKVSFAWAKGEEAVLKDISLSLKPGDSVHVHAAPGSGTTTLLKLLAGIYQPGEGSVRIDGREASRIGSEEAARHVAYLPPQGVIFRGTVLENLTGFSTERRGAALELAGHLGITTAVLRLPQGYDTPLEGGSADLIPPGLAQRIALVRALLEKPKLILFDQAERSLDKEGYNHVFTLLGKLKGRATLVLVSGDHNLARLASTRLHLQDGQLIAERRDHAARPLRLMQELAG